MKRKGKARTLSQARSLDCEYYSRCLMQAAQEPSSFELFSCSMCRVFKRAEVTDEDRVLETIRALKLLDALWKHGETHAAPA